MPPVTDTAAATSRRATRQPLFIRRGDYGSAVGYVVVSAFTVLANALYAIGYRNQNPVSWTSNISSAFYRGQVAIDPNVGYITQSLGHVAALSWLHGHIPWWNHLAGVGMPLAGGMQAGAFNPLVLFLALPGDSMFWFHLSLELVAGWSTYAFAARFFRSELVGCLGGIIFGLNGTFAWVGNSVLNPVAYLPLGLLGVEVLLSKTKKGEWGWALIMVALSLSIVAGFPEVAGLDGMFIAGYALVRLTYLDRSLWRRTLGQLTIGGLGAVALSAPLLIAFEDYLKVADVGIHSDTSHTFLVPQQLSMLLDPYVVGPINGVMNLSPLWGGIGGYFTMSVVLLALFGCTGPTFRRLRWFLVAWVIVTLMASLNTWGLGHLWFMIPAMKKIVLGRYVIAADDMALVILAMFGLDDLLARRRRPRSWSYASLAAIGVMGLVVLGTRATTYNHPMGHAANLILLAGQTLPFGLIAVMWLAGALRRQRVLIGLVALCTVFEATISYAVPEVLAPHSIQVARAPLTFLQDNLGQYRYVSFGPIQANWGSYFGIAALNAHDLPFPQMFETLIKTQIPLKTGSPLPTYTTWRGASDALAYEGSVAANLDYFENAGVKYAISYDNFPLNPAFAALHLPVAYNDGRYIIFALPHPVAMYTATGCTVVHSSLDGVTISCPKAETLVRRELSMPGWTATVNGRAVPLTLSSPYQQVPIPAGTSTVNYNFTPPHERLGFVVFFLSLAALVISGRRNWLHRRGRRMVNPLHVARHILQQRARVQKAPTA